MLPNFCGFTEVGEQNVRKVENELEETVVHVVLTHVAHTVVI
jgi:hypothetical protein